MFEKKNTKYKFWRKTLHKFSGKTYYSRFVFLSVTITFCRNKIDAMLTKNVLILEKMFQFLLHIGSNVSISFSSPKKMDLVI